MSKRIQNTIIILITFFSFKGAYSQSLSVNDLVKGETYVLERKSGSFKGHLRVFHYFNHSEALLDASCTYTNLKVTNNGYIIYTIDGAINEVFRDSSDPKGNEIYIACDIYYSEIESKCNSLRKATQEEKDWLNACIEAGKFIPKEEALKNKKQENVIADSQTVPKRNTDNKPKEKTEQKYDAFGNPINPKSPNQTQTKTDPKENTKYDAFGNPVDSNSPNNTVKKEETPNDKPKQQYDAFGNPIADKTEQKVPTKTVNNASTMFVGVAIEYFTCNGKQHTRILGWIKEKYDYDANDPNSKNKGHEYIKKRTLERYPNASTTMTYDVEYEKSQNTVIAIVNYQNCQYLNQPQNCNVGKSNVINPSKNHWNRKFEELKKDSCVKDVEVIIE